MLELIFEDNIRTFKDWDLKLTDLVVSDPVPKEHYVDIPSGDGSLDLTEALTGETSYENRLVTATFVFKPSDDWNEKLTEIRSYLNGRKRMFKISNEPNFYYFGRFRTEIESVRPFVSFSVTAICDPYKLKHETTVKSATIGSSGTVGIILTNSRKRVIPTISASGKVNMSFRNQSISVNSGTHRYTNIYLEEGDNPITISGSQGITVTFEYQEGAL